MRPRSSMRRFEGGCLIQGCSRTGDARFLIYEPVDEVLRREGRRRTRCEYSTCDGAVGGKKGEPSWSLVFAKLTHKLKVAIEPTAPYRVSSCWYFACTVANTRSEAI